MRVAVCPGSYDPITFGHLDVIVRSRAIFDEVVIAIAQNPAKNPLLPLAQRVSLCESAVLGLSRVRVEVVPGLLAQFCKDLRVATIIKGLRGGIDFEHEVPMAAMNRKLAGVETLFIAGDGSLAHISSSLVKDVARHGGPIDGYTTLEAAVAVRARIKQLSEPGGTL